MEGMVRHACLSSSMVTQYLLFMVVDITLNMTDLLPRHWRFINILSHDKA